MKKKVIIAVFIVLFGLILLNIPGYLRETENTDTAAGNLNTARELEASIEDNGKYDKQQDKVLIHNRKMDLESIRKIVFPEDTGKSTLDTSHKNVEILTTDEGLNISTDMVYYTGTTKAWEKYNDFIYFRPDENISDDNISIAEPTDQELSFMTREELQEKIIKLVNELGINFTVDEIAIKAYTAEYFEELLEQLENDSLYHDFIKEETFQLDWTEADALYYAKVKFAENDIPISDVDYSTENSLDVLGLHFEVYLTRDGVQLIETNAFKEKENVEEIEICNSKEALEAIRRKYDNIVMEDDIDITDIHLEYEFLPDAVNGDVYMTPVYRFDTETLMEMFTESNESGEYLITDTIHINAQTGRLLE